MSLGIWSAVKGIIFECLSTYTENYRIGRELEAFRNFLYAEKYSMPHVGLF